MTTTQQPEALNLEEFRAKVTRAAREPLLARIAELEDVADMAIKRIAELEAQLAAIGAGGVEPLRKQAAPATEAPQVRADARDAARYSWLRARDLETICRGGVFAGMTPQNVILNGKDLDAAIDAALAAQAKQGERP